MNTVIQCTRTLIKNGNVQYYTKDLVYIIHRIDNKFCVVLNNFGQKYAFVIHKKNTGALFSDWIGDYFNFEEFSKNNNIIIEKINNPPKWHIEIMRRFKVKNTCFCEEYLHEITNYPRPGLVEKKLFAGDEVEFEKSWSNFYGHYYRVTKDNNFYDILPANLEEIQ